MSKNHATLIASLRAAWDSMSFRELLEMRGHIDQRLASKRSAEMQDIRRRLSDMAKKNGYKIQDLIGGKKPMYARKGLPKAPAKYKDPTTGKTWSGRGRPPNWLTKYIRDTNGRMTREHFLIKK